MSNGPLLVCIYCMSESVQRYKRLANDEYEHIIRFVCKDCGYHMAFNDLKVEIRDGRYVIK